MTIKPAPTAVAITTTIAVGLLVACGGHRPAVQPQSQDLFVLMPNDDNSVGRATISNPVGTVDLTGAFDATRVANNRTPAPAATMDKADVERVFHDVLAGLPPTPQHFTVYFQFASDELTGESRALTPQILQAVKTRPHPEVIVVGHTDTTGSPASNHELGLKRATIVRNLLVAEGLQPSAIEVTSHGEGDLLVRTPDETYEPRNRRVEIDIQ
jgi:outer membrane protein OmpA-like peptidoglycan-associated protein